MKKLVKLAARAAGVLLAAICIFAASLFFREQSLPRCILDRIEERLSPPGFKLRCRNVSFGFRHGLRLDSVRFSDLSKGVGLGDCIFTAAHVDIHFIERTVRIDEARYPRLPDSWYLPLTEPPKPLRLDFEIPDLPEFTLVLDRPDILGIAPSSATAAVRCGGGKAVFDGVEVVIPESGADSVLRGRWTVDSRAMRLRGDLRGSVRPERIRPLLVAMDIPCAVAYMDAFTELPSPVPAVFELEAGLETQDVEFTLELSPAMGRYNGAALERAAGTLRFSSRIPYGASKRPRTADWEWRDNVFSVHLPLAVDAEGRKLEGDVEIGNKSGRYRAVYDVKSGLALGDIAKIAEVVPETALQWVECETPPVATLSGTSATEADDWKANDLRGTVALERGAVRGFRVRNLAAEWTLSGDRLEGAGRARGKTGGRISCEGGISLGGFAADAPMDFTARCVYKGGSLEETADLLPFDPGERKGRVDGWLEVSGTAGTNVWRTLRGKGSVSVTEGRLARAKLFVGLTDILADKVAGISFLVNQTDASADFTIENGVVSSDNVYLQGGLVSVKGWGTYDLAEDRLDFTVRVQLLKKDSVAGMILQPVTWPFTKFLFEFRLTGPAADPEWSYIKPHERIF
ncbi:MAG: hypothetical protein IIT98_00755 [Kiritimatiellae bacterium]|nr:hypothetical protein [Kiritimatiellia bacterium]